MLTSGQLQHILLPDFPTVTLVAAGLEVVEVEVEVEEFIRKQASYCVNIICFLVGCNVHYIVFL